MIIFFYYYITNFKKIKFNKLIFYEIKKIVFFRTKDREVCNGQTVEYSEKDTVKVLVSAIRMDFCSFLLK